MERGNESPARAGHAPAGELLFREGLVQGDAERVRVATRGRNAEFFEEGGKESPASFTPVPFGQVEHDVRSERLQSGYEQRGRAGDVKWLDPVPGPRESALDGMNGLRGIELGFLFRVGHAKIVGESDSHPQRTSDAPSLGVCAGGAQLDRQVVLHP